MSLFLSLKRSRQSSVRLEMAPLMDVVFLLLIFFAVTSTVILNNQGIKLNLPAAESVQKQVEGLTVSVDAKGRVYFDGERITEDAIRTYVARAIQKNQEQKVILNADRLTPYSQVIRVLDEIRLGGCFNVVLEAKKFKAT